MQLVKILKRSLQRWLLIIQNHQHQQIILVLLCFCFHDKSILVFPVLLEWSLTTTAASFIFIHASVVHSLIDALCVCSLVNCLIKNMVAIIIPIAMTKTFLTVYWSWVLETYLECLTNGFLFSLPHGYVYFSVHERSSKFLFLFPFPPNLSLMIF